MTAEHLRAVAQTAFVAQGFTLPFDEATKTAERQWRSGRSLCSQILSGILGDADTEEMKRYHINLWNRAPLIANLGFELVEFFGEQLGASEEALAPAAQLGAGFNLAIVVIDHLLDETDASERLLRILDASVIRRIFFPNSDGDGGPPQTEVGKDACERLAFKLIEWCAANGRKLLAATGNDNAWQDLAKAVGRLLESERRLAKVHWPNGDDARAVLPWLEAKSVLPAIACLHIARLAMYPGANGKYQVASQFARRLGTITWLLDDTVDLIDDLRAGSPNALLVRLANKLDSTGVRNASDLDIYSELEASVAEIIELIGPAPTDRMNEERKFQTFAKFIVAGWMRWKAGEPDANRPVATPDTPMIHAGIEFLLREQACGFEEAKHYLHFPRLDQPLEYETHAALLSHRAVILDALLDAVDAGIRCPRRVLAEEVMAILKSKHPYVRGGWNYIQQVTELPPDADDLGQVLQELMRFGGAELASICEDSLRLAIDSADEGGGFCTWILDPGGRSIHHERIRQYLGVMGGWGVHPEVVANLLYGILLYDPMRYREALHCGARYLESVQNANGSWSSKWYRGAFYGTWRAVSVLATVTPESSSLKRARHFLLSSQHSDGGWGEKDSEPLSSALAVLGLCAGWTERIADAAAAGCSFLRAAQAQDGSWPSFAWIAFPTIDGEVVHGSRSITTAFCLKALIAAQSAGYADSVVSEVLRASFK